MKEGLLTLKRAIGERRLLSEEVLAAYDWDGLLDARDSDGDFEAQWLRVSAGINELMSAAKVETEARQFAEDIGRELFLAVSQITGGHELASYVADDFELIARAVATGYDDPWLNGLWMAYKANGLPEPPVKEHRGKLLDLIGGAN
jgi:hypothetical protein